MHDETYKKVKKMRRVLKKMYPKVWCELNYSNSLDLLVAVMLSAQTTDVSVNKITSTLFTKYKSVDMYAHANLMELENDIKSIGLYRTKAKNIKKTAQILIEKHSGKVPDTAQALEELPGVGRKTANVVRSVVFGQPAFAVDTHVARISWRLGFTHKTDTALQVEQVLTNVVPKKQWSITHHRMIFFGRYFCMAKKPMCQNCVLQNSCEYFKNASTSSNK